MNFKRKVLFSQAALLIGTISIISCISIWSIYQKGQSDIESYRVEQIEASKEKLRTSVEMVASMIENALKSSNPEVLKLTIEYISDIRYDGGEGYFWMTDDLLPYPSMVMHGIRKNDAGKVLDDEKFNTLIDYPDKNLYQFLVEESLKNGESFADYKMHKPGIEGYIPKMTYAYLIPSAHLVIYTGIYMDQVERNVALKEAIIGDQIFDTVALISGLTLLILVGAMIAVNYFSGTIITIILSVKQTLRDLSLGKIAEKLRVKRNDEIQEMVDSLNQLITRFKEYTQLANEISMGKLDEDEHGELDDDDQLGKALHGMRSNLTEVINEIKEVITQIGQEGDLSARLPTQDKQYAWKEIGQVINEMTGAIRQPFHAMNQVIESMANGDLSQRLENAYRGDIYLIINNLNSSLDELSALISQINGLVEFIEGVSEETAVTGNEMKLASTEMNSAITEISNGANNQVSRIESSSRHIEQIMTFSTELGSDIQSIAEMANRGKQESEVGLSVIKQMTSSFGDVLKQSSEANQSFEVLQNRSIEINKIVTVISEIASQTNLLALNAAIEAAQAGEAGRGFAVVAEEIRNLAESSRQSVQEIELLVSGIQEDTGSALERLKNMSGGIKESEQATREVSERFHAIDLSTRETAKMSERIMHSSVELVEDAKLIVTNTESVIVIAEQTASGAEELTTSSHQFTSGMQGYFEKSNELHHKTLKLKEQLATFIFKTSEDELEIQETAEVQ